MTDNILHDASYVFLSYASADRERALRIADLLEARRVTVWIDRKSIPGGTSWSSEIVEGIKGCAVLLALITPSAARSRNVQQEIQLAWEHERKVLPLLAERSELPSAVEYALAGRQWVEVLSLPEADWLPQALRALRGLGIPAEDHALATYGQTVAAPNPTGATMVSTGNAGPLHNLPAQVTSFVGREKELAEVKDRLRTTRLLTLTGTGGCGKTRLALQVAGDLVDTYPDGVWLVELAPLADSVLVPGAVAAALGVREGPGQPIQATVLSFLRSRQLLLVVDNCEHLIDACAQFADAVLRACPDIRILATSREALGIAGEVSWRLPSLSAPHRDVPSDELTRYESVRLFADRAQAVQPDFRLSAENAPPIAAICRRLDGIPLAIELAAARVRVLTVEHVAARLEDRFRLLTGGSRASLPRQQTLRATLDWSYNLLPASEQRLLRRLAVFAGGWALEAAEAVCSGDGLPLEEVFDGLTKLVDKSLVLVDQRGREERYQLQETIRQYGRDRLVEAGEAEHTRERHRDFYLHLAERTEPELFGAEQAAQYARLELEHDNLRASLEWCLERGPAELGLRLAGAVCVFWYMRDHFSEGRSWLERVLAQPEALTPTVARARALWGAYWLAVDRGQEQMSHHLAEACLEIYRETGDQRVGAWSFSILGYSALAQADHVRAEALFARNLELAREIGDSWLQAQALLNLGTSASERGDDQAARPLLDQSLALFRELGDQRAIASVLDQIGLALCRQGSTTQAHTYFTEALEKTRQLGSKTRIGGVLLDLGALERIRSNFGQSRVYLGESLTLARETEDPVAASLALCALGWLARAEGDPGSAWLLIQESLRHSREIGRRAELSRSIAACCGVLSVDRGEHRSGARMFGWAEAQGLVRTMLFLDERQAYARSVEAARAALGDDAFSLAWAEGQVMTLEQAIANALEYSMERPGWR